MQLQERLEQFTDRDAEIWSITPDSSLEKLESLRSKEGLSIPILVDADLDVTTRYGILTDDGQLPHPTALVIAPDGTVLYSRVDENFRDRPSVDELLDAVPPKAAPTTEPSPEPTSGR